MYFMNIHCIYNVFHDFSNVFSNKRYKDIICSIYASL